MWEKKGNHEFGKRGNDKENIVCMRKVCFPRSVLRYPPARVVTAE
jgi:hypothetical protein